MTLHALKFTRNPANPDETITEINHARVFLPAPPFEPNTRPEVARYIRDYKCRDCGWIGKRDEMEADATGDDSYWSGHICPGCGRWWQGLDEGYEMVIP